MIFDWKREYYRYHRYFFDIQRKVISPRLRSFTWLSLTVFTTSFFIIAAIKPTLVTVAKLQREIKDKQEANEKLQTKINSLILAQAEMVNYLDDVAILDQSLPNNSEYYIAAANFENYAGESGVNLKSLSFNEMGDYLKVSNKSGTGKYKVIPFNLSASGNYGNLKSFLNLVENSSRLLLVEASRFNAISKETGGELTISITGKILYQGSMADMIPTKK